MEKQDNSAMKALYGDGFVGEPRENEVTESIHRLGMNIKSRSDLDNFIAELKKLYALFPNERTNGFSQELLDILAEKDKESEKDSNKTGELLSNMFNGGEPKNIDPLTEIPEPQIRLFGYSNHLGDSSFYGTEEELIEYLRNNKCDMTFGDVSIIEFMGTMAGRSDVIRKTYRNGKQSLVTVATDDHIGTYNHIRSCHQGQFVWEGNAGNLRAEYKAFRERGIAFKDDVYAQADERHNSLMKMMKENNLFNMGTKSDETGTAMSLKKKKPTLFGKKD